MPHNLNRTKELTRKYGAFEYKPVTGIYADRLLEILYVLVIKLVHTW
jgi:hypothetical protein